MTPADPSPFDGLVQAVHDGRLFALLGTPPPELTGLRKRPLQFSLQSVCVDLSAHPDRLIAALQAQLGVDAQLELHSVSWHPGFSEHSVVIGSTSASDPWGMLLKSDHPDDTDASSCAWLSLFKGPTAVPHLCRTVERNALRLTALRIEAVLSATSLPYTFEQCIELRELITESDVGQRLFAGWDAHVRGAALEETLLVQPSSPRRSRRPRL